MGTHQKSSLQNEWMNECRVRLWMKNNAASMRAAQNALWIKNANSDNEQNFESNIIRYSTHFRLVWPFEQQGRSIFFWESVCANESSYFPNAHSPGQTNPHVLATFCIVQAWMICFLPPNDEQDHLLHPPPIIARQPNLSESDLLRMIVTCTETKDDGEDQPMERLARNDSCLMLGVR